MLPRGLWNGVGSVVLIDLPAEPGRELEEGGELDVAAQHLHVVASGQFLEGGLDVSDDGQIRRLDLALALLVTSPAPVPASPRQARETLEPAEPGDG